jgi:hypothetical protein
MEKLNSLIKQHTISSPEVSNCSFWQAYEACEAEKRTGWEQKQRAQKLKEIDFVQTAILALQANEEFWRTRTNNIMNKHYLESKKIVCWAIWWDWRVVGSILILKQTNVDLTESISSARKENSCCNYSVKFHQNELLVLQNSRTPLLKNEHKKNPMRLPSRTYGANEPRSTDGHAISVRSSRTSSNHVFTAQQTWKSQMEEKECNKETPEAHAAN